MKTSFLFKAFISLLVAFNVMTKYLFEQYADMALAGRNYNYGIEAGMSDAFLYFLAAVVIGIVVWFICMLVMSFIGRFLNRQINGKRRVKKEDKEGDVFHD
jgi:hypothetical protein